MKKAMLMILLLLVISLINCGGIKGYEITFCSKISKTGCERGYIKNTFSDNSTFYIEVKNPNELTNRSIIISFYDEDDDKKWSIVESVDFDIYAFYKRLGTPLKKGQYASLFWLGPVKMSDLVDSGTEEGKFKIEITNPSDKKILGSSIFYVK